MIDSLWSEIFIIAIIALIFLGPSELFVLLKGMGRFIGKCQQMANHLKMMMDHEIYRHEKSFDIEIKDIIDNDIKDNHKKNNNNRL